MFVIIVGAGKVGRYLINDLLKKDNEVTLIEQDQEKCRQIKERYGVIKTINGDGSKREVLEEAEADRADVLLAVTQDDQDNLVICQLAERQFSVPRTFTRVNTPGNEKLFDWLGVNVAVSSASILSALVDQEVAIKDIKNLLNRGQEKLRLVRIPVARESEAANKKLKNIDLPLESILVTILRGDSPIVPRGNTRIVGGDMIVALSRAELEEDLIAIFS